MSSALLSIVAGSGMTFTQPSVNAALPNAGNLVTGISAPAVAGGVGTPVVTTIASVPGVLAGHFLYDFYYRIWVIPTTLLAQNPQYDTPIPFYIWNAYPQPDENNLDLVSGVDADGLTVEGATPAAFGALEYRQMGIVITPDAPGNVDATFTFDFAAGVGFLRFVASIANVLALQFEDGIRVEYAWLTDVLERYDGSEQRLALRERPRRTFGGDIVLTDDADRKALYDQIYKTATGLIVIPMFQHQTPLRAPTVIGDNKIYCNTKRANLRVGGYVLLLKRNGAQVLAKVSAIFADYVEVETAHSEAVAMSGTKVMSAITTRLPDQSGLTMRAKDGTANLIFSEYQAQDTLTHPLATVALTPHYGTPVLERRPLATDADEKFSTGLTTIDNETGRPARFTAWDQKYVTGERQYLINTLFDSDDLDYWYTFLEYCRGQQKHFLASTWREDLVWAGVGSFTVNTIEVAGLDYAQLYAEVPTYGNLEIETDQGTFWVKVLAASSGVSSTVITFQDAITADTAGNAVGDLSVATVTRISYLMTNRLGSDRVSVTHRNTYATLTLNLKAV